MRRWGKAAAAACTFLLSALCAAAGDFAAFQPIGFSDDGKVFAFEEYGIQDGSGFPYSNIFFVDIENDGFLPQTPVRVRIDSEDADLARARAESRSRAGTLIERYGLDRNPGLLAAFNPAGEVADRTRIRYHQHTVEPQPGGPFTLVLEETPLSVTPACKDIVPEGKGFRLRLAEIDGEPADKVVYEDTRIPESRRCPVSYQISGAITFHPREGEPIHIALVLVRSFGFEGNDGRWLAVPVRP
ncbi:MAG: DUF2259 domain-containing protein [Shinella sp.]|nr:DUF2259 domain-containing protein [Shinella sp.]